MPVSLSIKNVPDDVAERLRERAKRNHRSIQGELLAMLEEELGQREELTPSEVLRRVRASGLRTPDEATPIIREDRDTDHGRVQRDPAMRDQKELQEPAPTIPVKELSEWVKARGFTTKSDSVQILREERDTDHGRLPHKVTVNELYEHGKKRGLKTASDSVEILRELRDGRNRS